MNKEFQVHMLNDTGKAKAQAIAEAFDGCLSALLAITPAPSREMSPARHYPTARSGRATRLQRALRFDSGAWDQERRAASLAGSPHVAPIYALELASWVPSIRM
jgi:hypothetical protein